MGSACSYINQKHAFQKYLVLCLIDYYDLRKIKSNFI